MTVQVHKALQTAFDFYVGIEDEYIDAFVQAGVKFAPYDAERATAHDLRRELAARGACLRNGGASVSSGALSEACVACTSDCVSQTFEITNRCHRNCFFCFNRNQENYEYYCTHLFPWREQLESLALRSSEVACIALTGGEPMLMPDETFAFFRRARALFPDTHLRLYTSGDLLDTAALSCLSDCGLDEIRFSVKLDDALEQQQRVLDAMQASTEYIPQVLVEMPAIPGTAQDMKHLLRSFDELGIHSINLLEFTFPLWNWEAFEARGLSLKNPPFPVLYDYSYAGSLAVQGSEELCLELMIWALDEGLTLGLHYCSLENKHRSEIRLTNEPHAQVHPCYAFDREDFFLKAAKVYGQDCGIVRKQLQALGCQHVVYDDEDESLTFHPRYIPKLAIKNQGVCPVISYNVAVDIGGELVLRELKIELASTAPEVVL